MAFMQQLKGLRLEHGLSQQALADAIFVSRSAIAKWENGLGLPSNVCYTALLSFFAVPEACLEITAEDQMRIRKRYRNRGICLLFIGLPILLCGVSGCYFAFYFSLPPLFGMLPANFYTWIYVTVVQFVVRLQGYPVWQNALVFGGLIILGAALLCWGLALLRKVWKGRIDYA